MKNPERKNSGGVRRVNCRIAGIGFELNLRYPYTVWLCRDYLVSGGSADVVISCSNEEIAAERSSAAESPAVCESAAVFRKICLAALDYDGFVFHSSAVAVNGEAYLFAAASGVGKSTHVALWRKKFGPAAIVVNDDKPIIRRTGRGFEACGTPWCGKAGLQTPTSVPVKGICLLQRSADNRIERIAASSALAALLNQTLRPDDERKLDRLLALYDELAHSIPLYSLNCNLAPQAADISYEGMRR